MDDVQPGAELILRCPPVGATYLPADLRALIGQGVTILHTQIRCSECAEYCWIGPSQLRALVEGKYKGRPVCWICIVRNPVHLRNVGRGINVTSPTTRNAPKRENP